MGAVMLTVLEATSRVEDLISYGMPLMSRVTDAGDLVLRDSLGARGRPNAVFRRWRMDSLGLRGPNVPRLPAAGARRIVVTGSSETFGLYESARREYPRQLEDTLRARLTAQCGDAAPHLEVLNAALPGMALPSLTANISRVVGPLAPALLVIYPSPSFYLNPRIPSVAEGSRADTSLAAGKAWRLRIRDRVITQVKALAPGWAMTWARQRAIQRSVARFPQGWRWTELPVERLDQFEQDLRAAVGAARALHVEPVLMGYVAATMAPGFDDPALLVAWEYQFPRAPRDVIPAFHDAAGERIARVAADSATAYVDLRAGLDGEWTGTFADFVHFTDLGAARVANTLGRSLIGSGTVGCPATAAP